MKTDRHTSTAHQIYESLRRQIIDFTLEPGTILVQKKIAEDFGVSLSPVRDAALRLEAEGLIEIIPQSKTFVSLIDVQHAWETHFLRLSVEIQVVRELAATITAEQIEEMRNWQRRLGVELTSQRAAFQIADNGFHEYLYGLAGVGGLWQLIRTRRAHYDRMRGLYLIESGNREIVIEEHGAIISAIAAGDPEGAEAAVRGHLGKALRVVDEIRARTPSYFL